MIERVGRYTMKLTQGPVITGYAGVAGKKEGEGPLAEDFDFIFEDTTIGEKSWEKAESAMLREAVSRAMDKANKSPSDLDFLLAGDLLDQCISATFGLRGFNIPFLGMYGACSTMALTMSVGALLTEAGASRVCGVGTSSHFCSAERQFRFPLEYGGQRTPTAQWTVTGAGCAILEPSGSGPRITAASIGRICDLGIKDANNMGAAMAPAAAETIASFLEDTKTQPGDYDLILTGDLGYVGSELLLRLLQEQETDIAQVHDDCGMMIFDRDNQDVHAGGSGCGCSGSVLNTNVLKRMAKGELNRVLFVGTGALMSPTSSQQGESIPGIAHAVLIQNQ